ncbi:MAG: glutamyl-tRNA reductase [Methanomassiliicoccales archaeon]
MIISAHITHKSADMKALELIGRHDEKALLHALLRVQGVRECAVLRTCNRVELYVVTDEPTVTRTGMEEMISRFIPFDHDQNLVQFRTDIDSIRHLLRVSSGLESMIVGEDQIQFQVKKAYELAENEKCAGPILSLIFRKAISVGKKVRTETRVNKGAVSIGSAAVDLAEKILGSLEGRTVLVIGAGEMATLIAKHLLGKKPNAIFVSNRTFDRAVELAWYLGGQAIRLDSLYDYLHRCDIVLVATSSPHIILDRSRVEKALTKKGKGEKLIIIDVSFPRNVADDVRTLENVEMHDIDGLRDIAQENILKRKEEVHEAERIIAEELSLLERKLEEMGASELIRALRQKFEAIKEAEIKRAINRLNNSPESIESIVADFANALANRFLADPTEVLKLASRNKKEEILKAARELFRLEESKNVS